MPALVASRKPFPRAPEIGAMTKAIRFGALIIGCASITTGMAGALAGDEKTATPEQVLKDKGLTKDDRKFLLDEAAALKKYEEAKKAYAGFQKAFGRYAAIAEYDETLQGMEMDRQAMQQQVAALQAQMNGASAGAGRYRRLVNAELAPMRQQVSQSQVMINQMNAQIQAFKGQAPKADERKKAPEDLKLARQAYIDSVRELSELVTPLLAKYHELALDKAVTDALVQLRKTTTLNYKLGPSDPLVAASKMTQDVKKNTAATTKPASKRKAKAKGS